MATFNEKHASTSKKYVVEQGILMSNRSKITKRFRLHFSVFAIENLLENLNFRVFFPLIGPLVATFSESCASTSRTYVAEQRILIPNWWKTFQTFWSHSSVFALETQPENLNFESFFTSNRLFGSYFQWKAYTDFQKICSWTRYSNAKLIKNISNLLVALLRFFL